MITGNPSSFGFEGKIRARCANLFILGNGFVVGKYVRGRFQMNYLPILF